MNLLFLGAGSGTAKHRADALRRLGYTVHQIDPDRLVPQGRLASRLHWETGGLLCEKSVTAHVLTDVGASRFDLTWVDNGRYVGPLLIHELQGRYGPVLNYNVDDPYGRRDRFSWSLYKRAVSAYNLVAVVREENVAEAQALKARKVIRVYRSADEAAHAPRALTAEDHARWDSEVVFAGTWMRERGPFLVDLLRRGVPLTLYGNGWQRAKEWPLLEPVWKGPDLSTADDYAKAIQCAKVVLGLLSKGNRDLHTTRSLEVPSLGGVFCAERTREHQFLYQEGEEAAFWSDAAECAEVCLRLLNDDARRTEIGRRGRVRCLRNGTMNEQIMAHIISEVPPVPPVRTKDDFAHNSREQ